MVKEAKQVAKKTTHEVSVAAHVTWMFLVNVAQLFGGMELLKADTYATIFGYETPIVAMLGAVLVANAAYYFIKLVKEHVNG